jgi:serine/threonine protein kinase
MPSITLVNKTSRSQLLSNTLAATSNTDHKKQNQHHIANDAPPSPALPHQAANNIYGASVISINGARIKASIEDNPLPPNEVILDQLTFTQGPRLGHGGQADIYTLIDQHKREFAGKVFMKPEALASEQQSYLSIGPHPNIVRCYGSKEIEGKNYLIMEKIPGKELSKVIEDLDNYSRIAPKDVAQYAPALRLMLTEQLIDVLKFLGEKEINHTDLKPDNILISKDAQLKLIDFGLSKSHQENPNSSGTLHYMAPESLVAHHEEFPKIDSYAAGNITLQLTTGHYLEQDGSLSHRATPSHLGFYNGIVSGGDLLIKQINPLHGVPLSSSGQFFSATKPNQANHQHPNDPPTHLNRAEANYHANTDFIDQQLIEKLGRNLLQTNPENRPGIHETDQTIKEMAEAYLTKEIRGKAIALLRQLNRSPVRDFMHEERSIMQSRIDQGQNYVEKAVPYMRNGKLYVPITKTESGTTHRPADSVSSSATESSANARPISNVNSQADIIEKPTLEQEKLQLDHLELGNQELRLQLSKLVLEKKLQEQQRHTSLVQAVPPSEAKIQNASVNTSLANKKKVPLLAD